MNSLKKLVVLTAAYATVAGPGATAATLTAVPMQGAMVHVGIEYSISGATTNLSIHLDPAIPVLMPLTLSHPGDQFTNTAPWFADLDPSAAGKAFNRQYGFVLDGLSDPLDGNSIWIRQLTASPGLEAFRYRTAPDTWAPLFGTAGSSTTLEWNMGMFHPAYTVPAGVGTYSATYEAFVVNAGIPTGVSEEFTLQWQAIPEPTTVGMTLLGLGVVGWTLRRRPAKSPHA